MQATTEAVIHPPNPKGAQPVLWRSTTPWLRRTEAFLERYLKFEHGANIFPFLHIVFYFGMLALFEFGFIRSLWLAVPCWLLLVLASYSLSIGVQHLHTHRKMFTSPVLNRITETLLTIPAGVSHPLMKYIHVHLHHRYDNGAGDPTSTQGKERGLAALKYWLTYGLITHKQTFIGLFGRDAKPSLKRMRAQHLVDLGLHIAFGVAFFVYDPRGMILFFLIPYILTSINIGYFAWLTHAPAREGRLNNSINSANNWMNLFVMNQGYHTVHHIRPSIHWTAIPEYLDLMRSVDDDLIVPYWVTLNSSYRLLSPDSFRNQAYGGYWKQKYVARSAQGKKRLSFLPYFGWI